MTNLRPLLALLALFIVTPAQAEPPPAEQGVYVAVGYGGRRLLSRDGSTWEITAEWAENGGDDNNNLMGLAFGKGKFVAVGGGGGSKDGKGGRILVSSDGKTWKETKTMSFRVNPVLFGNARFVVGGPDRKLYWSEDGETWQSGAQIDHPGREWAFWFRVGAFGNGLHLMVGNSGKDQKEHWCAVTKNGEQIEHFISDLPPVRDIAFGNGRFVLVGPNGLRLSSADGKTWEHKATEEGVDLGHVVWTDKEFLATGGGAAYHSKDGEKWEKSPKNIPCGVVWADDRILIGTTWPGQMWSSTDGKDWTRGAKMTPNGINKVLYGVPTAKKE